MNRKLLLIVSALILSLAIALPAAAGRVMDRINKTKLIRVGTDPHFPPLIMKTVDSGIMGFEVDMMATLARSLDMKIKWVEMPFPELFDAVLNDKIDMAVCGISVTGARNLKLVFVGPYMSGGQSMCFKKKDIARFSQAQSINSPDVRVAAAKGTTAERTVPELMPKAKVTWAANQQAAMRLLREGKVDVLVADYPLCIMAEYFLKSAGVVAMRKPFTYEPYGIAIKPGDPHLQNLLHNFISSLEGAGVLKGLKKRWFEQTNWIKRLRTEKQ